MFRPNFKMITLALLSLPFVGACEGSDETSPLESEAPGINSLNGLNSINGLTSLNGLNSINGLSATSGLITTSAGRDTITYLVRCALPLNHNITKTYNGTTYTFAGQLGMGPGWETGACDTNCQQLVSACMLAHVNTSGQHVNLWLDSDAASVGWGQSSAYPYQEGSFFGNIFTSPPQAYYCNGKDFDLGVVAGRLGATQTGTPYVAPYGTNLCSTFCNAHGTDGFNSCPTYNPGVTWPHIVTVWRNFDAGTKYKICNKANNQCLGVSGNSTADNVAITQSTYSSSNNSLKWNVVTTSAGKFKITNVASGRAISTANGGTTTGTPLVQKTYASANSQIWTISSLTNNPGYYQIASVAASTMGPDIPYSGTNSSPTNFAIAPYLAADTQKWTVSVAE